MRVVSPLGTNSSGLLILAQRPKALDGGTLGILWNGKQNADVLLRELASRLRARFALTDVVWLNKVQVGSGPPRPAPARELDDLSAGVTAVLAASGD